MGNRIHRPQKSFKLAILYIFLTVVASLQTWPDLANAGGGGSTQSRPADAVPLFSPQLEQTINAILEQVTDDPVNHPARPLPRNWKELRVELERMARPWEILGLNPNEAYMLLEGFHMPQLTAEELKKMSPEQAKTWAKLQAIEVKMGYADAASRLRNANRNKGTTQGKLNSRYVEAAYSRATAQLQRQLLPKKTELKNLEKARTRFLKSLSASDRQAAIDRGDVQIDRLRSEIESLQTSMSELTDAFNRITDPQKSAFELYRYTLLKSIYDRPAETAKLEKLIEKSVDAFAGGLSFQGAATFFDIVTSTLYGHPEDALKIINSNFFNPKGILSITVFGLAAEIPKSLILDLVLARPAGRMIQSQFKPLVKIASQIMELKEPVAGVKVPVTKQSAQEFFGKLGMGAGSIATHYLDKFMNSKGLQKAGNNLSEKWYFLTHNSVLDDQLLKAREEFEKGIPPMYRDIVLLHSHESQLPDVLRKFNLDPALAEKVGRYEELKEQKEKLSSEFWDSLGEGWDYAFKAAPGEGWSLGQQTIQMILASILAHKVEHLFLQPLIAKSGLTITMLGKKQLMRLKWAYGKNRAREILSEAMQKGFPQKTLAEKAALATKTEIAEESGRFMKFTVNLAENVWWKTKKFVGWKTGTLARMADRIPTGATGGFMGALVFLFVDRAIISELLPSILNPATLNLFAVRKLDKATQIAACILNNDYLSGHGCQFDGSPATQDPTTETDELGMPLNPAKYCSTHFVEAEKRYLGLHNLLEKKHPGENLMKPLDPTDCVRKIALMKAIKSYHLEWEDFRQKVVMPALSDRVDALKARLIEIDQKYLNMAKFNRWFEACKMSSPENLKIFTRQTNPDLLAFDQGGIGSDSKKERVAKSVLASCQTLPEFSMDDDGDQEESDILHVLPVKEKEGWHQALRNEGALLKEITFHLNLYLGPVARYVAKLEAMYIAKYTESYFGNKPRSETEKYIFNFYKNAAAGAYRDPGLLAVAISSGDLDAKANEEIAKFIKKSVPELRNTDSKALLLSGLKEDQYQKVTDAFVRSLAWSQASSSRYDDVLNARRDAEKLVFSKRIAEAAKDVVDAVYFDAKRPKLVETWLDKWGVPVSEVFSLTAHGLNILINRFIFLDGRTNPYNLLDSVDMEYRQFNTEFNKVYAGFWNYANPLSPNHGVKAPALQPCPTCHGLSDKNPTPQNRNNQRAGSQQLSANELMNNVMYYLENKDVNYFKTQLEWSPGNFLNIPAPGDFQSMALKGDVKELIPPLYKSMKENKPFGSLTFQLTPDLTSQIVGQFPNQNTSFWKYSTFELEQKALSVAARLATPAVPYFPIPTKYPEPLRRLDLIAREVASMQLILLERINGLYDEARSYQKLGMSGKNDIPACVELESMNLKMDEIVQKGDANQMRRFDELGEQCYQAAKNSNKAAGGDDSEN